MGLSITLSSTLTLGFVCSPMGEASYVNCPMLALVGTAGGFCCGDKSSSDEMNGWGEVCMEIIE